MTAILLALAATVLFGASSVMEQRSTKQVPERAALSPRLLVDLARRPLWLAAIAINVVGNLLQVVALHFGALAVVQPILVCNLLVAVLITVVAMRRPPDRTMLAGIVCCAAGVAGFLAVAQPRGGRETVSVSAALPLAVTVVVVLGGTLAAVRLAPAALRPLWLALACGYCFGVTAFLLKLVPATVPDGFGDPLRQWPLYMLVVVGPAGFLLNQNAFQTGRLISPVLAIITTVDPLVSIGLAIVLLKERVSGSPVALAVEVVSLALMTGGIAALAYRAPRIVSEVVPRVDEPQATAAATAGAR
ncbi:MAG: DMT family transporter [Nocardioidaceae bacterium]